MGINEAIILGLVQGLTEFLPVSSSGHLVLGKTLLGIAEQGIAFEVFVHFGTLLAVLTVFRNDLAALVKTFFSLFKSHNQLPIKERCKNDENLRLLIFIIIATLPAAIVGLLFKDYFENTYNDPKLVSFMLIITAFILLGTLFRPEAKKNLELGNTLIMGFAQAFAILPGISRSGSTISFGMYFRLSGDDAARFSFLMAVPAILGATFLNTFDLLAVGIDTNFIIILLIGTVVAYISGFIAIKTLFKIIRKGKLFWFAPYCLILGILGLLFL